MKSILSIVCFAVIGCGGVSESGTPKDETKIIEIDGCQYIWIDNGMRFTNGYAFSFTHKGNCKNPIHRHQP